MAFCIVAALWGVHVLGGRSFELILGREERCVSLVVPLRKCFDPAVTTHSGQALDVFFFPIVATNLLCVHSLC